MERFYASGVRTTDGLASSTDVEFLDAFLMEHYGRSAQQSFEEYWVALTLLRHLCERHDIHLVLVATPVPRDVRDYDYPPRQAWLGSLADHLGPGLLDTLPAFQAADCRTPTPLHGGPRDVAHPTPEGHRIVAEALADHLTGAARADGSWMTLPCTECLRRGRIRAAECRRS